MEMGYCDLSEGTTKLEELEGVKGRCYIASRSGIRQDRGILNCINDVSVVPQKRAEVSWDDNRLESLTAGEMASCKSDFGE